MAGHDHRYNPVGTVEIAERFGVARTTVDHWRVRDENFPEPTGTVGGRPAWHWPDVKAWGMATDRGHLLRAAAEAMAAGQATRTKGPKVPKDVQPLPGLDDRQPVGSAAAG